MNTQLKSKLITELVWLVGIVIASAAVEYIIIVLFDLHPIFSVKAQGFIGLMVIAYGIRMMGRLGKEANLFADSEDENKIE
ncbi:hypothetical protein [Fodinibius halophilus]|uniref:Uncharacterized protein n=1 Tax=Fodinibius halophilus TaxID=1736908 RepID=A0A6M1TIC0_9BACT|nr:hypothetical protein [Fodinibius halophilus]NGP89802.1 hypothetical protein [Fodinibius halophilus]